MTDDLGMTAEENQARALIDSDGVNLGAALEVIRRFFVAAPSLERQTETKITDTPEYVAAKLAITRLS